MTLTYPLFAYSDTDATFRVMPAASMGVHVRIDLDQDPDLEGYGDSFVIHIAEPRQVDSLINALQTHALQPCHRNVKGAVITVTSACPHYRVTEEQP